MVGEVEIGCVFSNIHWGLNGRREGWVRDVRCEVRGRLKSMDCVLIVCGTISDGLNTIRSDRCNGVEDSGTTAGRISLSTGAGER